MLLQKFLFIKMKQKRKIFQFPKFNGEYHEYRGNLLMDIVI